MTRVIGLATSLRRRFEISWLLRRCGRPVALFGCTALGARTGRARHSLLALPGSSAPGSSAPWNIVLLLTLLTLIPAIVLSMTPFVRLLIVFHFLRQALGTQTAPSNQTLIGLSLILTFFLMQPVGAAIYADAIVPLDAGHITMMAALDRSVIPDAPLHAEVCSRKRSRALCRAGA